MTVSFFEEGVAAGFPSPADDFLQKSLNLHELLVEHPAATFFVRVVGNSMVGAGIHPGDILVVDRAKEAHPGKVVVALYQGEFTVKRLMREGSIFTLKAENPDYPSIKVNEGDDFQVWGVVTYVLHRL